MNLRSETTQASSSPSAVVAEGDVKATNKNICII